MRLAVLYNVARRVVVGRPEDIVADKDMELVPQLVADELAALGHEVTLIEADWDLARRCLEFSPDLAVNLTEGFAGTNAHEHLAPCILEFIGIRYTGADPINMLTLRDKLYTKDILAWHGFPMAEHQLFVHPQNDLQLREFPLILKPVREEASIGIFYDSVVVNEAQLRDRLRSIFEVYKQPILVERFIVGREISIGVWGNARPEVLPACEFRFRGPDPLRWFRSFEYKWQEGKELMLPAIDVGAETLGHLRRYALDAHRLLRCRDYSRADFRVGENGEIYFLEHNFNPGIGPNTHGLNNTLPMMAEFAGIGYPQFLERILAFAMERYS